MREAELLVAIQANSVMAEMKAHGTMTLRLPTLESDGVSDIIRWIGGEWQKTHLSASALGNSLPTIPAAFIILNK